VGDGDEGLGGPVGGWLCCGGSIALMAGALVLEYVDRRQLEIRPAPSRGTIITGHLRVPVTSSGISAQRSHPPRPRRPE
jgi:hypothetical protein